MTVCIDTNVLLQALAEGNPCRPILRAWFTGRLVWVFSTSILLEYEEIICGLAGRERWDELVKMIEMVRALRPHSIIEAEPSFQFHTTPRDLDDAKFADGAIAVHADFVVTEDCHFRPLAGAGYKPQPITPAAFIAKYL